MNRNETKQLSYFPKAIDQAIIDKFGAELEPESTYDMFGTGTYVTHFKTEDPVLREKVEIFIEAYIAGNQELAERLRNPEKWL